MTGMNTKSENLTDRRAARKAETKFQRDLENYLEQRIAGLSTNVPNSASNKKLVNPIESFFIDERKLVWRLIGLVRTDVDNLKVKTSVTPKNWHKEWPAGPREVLPFVNGLIARHRALASLNFGLPEHVDFTGLARPWAFLAALKQHTARESSYPLEGLRLRADWDKFKDQEWKISVNLDGIFISGKGWIWFL